MSTTNVYLWVPNIIGYARIIMAIISYCLIDYPLIFLSLYSVSCLLDAFDGWAARHLNQCSRFGAILDMITDRCTTAGLICYLGAVRRDWMLACQALIALDFSSHYVHMYSSLATGSSSHKTVKKDQNLFMRLYYQSRIVLFLACAGNEAFFIGLYACVKWADSSLIPWLIVWVSAPVFAFKQFMNVVQLIEACNTLVSLDTHKILKQSSPQSK